jgi:dolichol-phosphate mannosyltransferase
LWAIKLIDLVIPVYNDGKNLLELSKVLTRKVKYNLNLFICYDKDNDDLFEYLPQIRETNLNIKLKKNLHQGPCEAIKTGIFSGNSGCVIVYPADDFLNVNLINTMYEKYKGGFDIVVCSRFMKGGSMVGCPILKSIIVRFVSYSLFILSSIPVRDASNGLRMFSRKLINKVGIESKTGFAYSLELLVKAKKYNFNICEIPSQWEERTIGSSKFKIFKWSSQYLKWYFYGLYHSSIFKKK